MDGQQDGEGRSLSRLAFHRNLATMPFNDAVTDVQPEACALDGRFCGEKRFEYPVHVFRFDADVGNMNGDLTVPLFRGERNLPSLCSVFSPLPSCW